MKKIAVTFTTLCTLAVLMLGCASNPAEKDLNDFRDYYSKRFPDTPTNDFINGVYSIDKGSRDQWESLEEFPPYEIIIEKGEKLFNTPFKNGKTYASCFSVPVDSIKSSYPYFDKKRKEVITLELALNDCRKANDEEPLKYKTGAITHLGAYLAFQGRGKTVNVTIDSSKESLEWYNRGKQHFYAKRGQLNMSCADCHYYNAGNRIRADILSPALGHTTHFPVYRNKWATDGDGMGTLHRRYGGCNKQVRAKPFEAQSEEYRALEYFHTYMSNGLTLNGPGVRK
ncbi:MAG: sulfur oxidation c-type cytochrome SoxA [Gammaproteobacteria bacterium]|nr:sulfur oxidation c-type cytochrome SoxA [Gammaproteobacteria bacterium]